MKKLISALLAVVIILSMSVSVFADTYIKYTYMDPESGCIYHFGNFDKGATDAGLIINGEKKSLKSGSNSGAFVISNASESGLFALGIKPASTYEGATYTAVPYSTVDGVDILGQSFTVDVNEYSKVIKDNVLNDVVCADVIGAITADDNETLTSSSKSGERAGYSLRTYGNCTANNHCPALLIKLDLTKIPDEVKELNNSNYRLTLNGHFTSLTQTSVAKPKATDYENGEENEAYIAALEKYNNAAALAKSYKDAEKGLTLNVYAADSAGDWSEADPITFNNGKNAYYFAQWGPNAKNPVVLDSTFVPKTVTNYQPFTFNLTSYIQSALAAGKTYTSIVVAVDKKHAVEVYNETEGIVRVREYFAVQPNETAPYTISCQSEDKSVAINSVSLDGIEIDMSKFNSDKEYTHNISYYARNQALPVVTATASLPSLDVSVTQATAENPVATIEMKYAGNLLDTYKVNFVTESVQPTTLYFYTSSVDKSIKGITAYDPNKLWPIVAPTSSGYQHIYMGSYDTTKTGGKTSMLTNAAALIELDLTQIDIEKFDREKPVFFSAASYALSYSKSAIISAYNLNEMYPDGISAVVNTDLHTKAENNKYALITADENRIASYKVNNGKGTGNDAAERIYLDVSDAVLEALDNGKTSCVIALAVDSFVPFVEADKIANGGDYQLNYTTDHYPAGNLLIHGSNGKGAKLTYSKIK